MEASLLYVALAFAAPHVLSALYAVAPVLLGLVFHIIDEKESSFTKRMDWLLKQEGWLSARDIRGLPRNGLHVIPQRLMIVWRSQTTTTWGEELPTVYKIFSVRSLEWLKELSPTGVIVRTLEGTSSNGWDSSTNRVDPPKTLQPWQLELCDALLDVFRSKGRARVLISGPTGIGKSSMGTIAAGYIKTAMESDPTVYYGFNPTLEGFGFLRTIGLQHVEKEPVIVVIDEFDYAIKKAFSNDESAKEGHSLCANKGTLNTFLDSLKDGRNLIVIATMNSKEADIPGDGSSTNTSRWDIRVNLIGKSKWSISHNEITLV